MNGKTARVWSSKAFEASCNQRTPRYLRHACIRLGVACFWIALALERRAFEVWREQRAQQRALASSRRGAEALRQCAERMREMVGWGQRWHCLSVPAWSLPDSPKMRGLGLGS